MQANKIPTGFLFVDSYSEGELETLSIGDYGKSVNIKADFLGFSNPINGVPNTKCKPLSEKWVITLSTQYGCSMNCTFCDCPKIKFGGNVSSKDLKKQFYSAIQLFPETKYTDRLNLHFARMGEPIFNDDVFRFSYWLAQSKYDILRDTGLRIEVIHPVLTTSCPRELEDFEERILRWCSLKNHSFNGQAGLQLSINSTSEAQRQEMFRNKALTLKELSEIANELPMPLGRKYCLNFAYASSFEVDAEKLRSLFNPEIFMVKITPIHNNRACRQNKIETIGGYEAYTPYRKVEEDLKAAGFDVLVFVPSMDEENGLVTCGNAILSGSKIKC